MNPRSNALQIFLLWTLQGLFLLRVLGQIYVGMYSPGWLPGWDEWYSGLLPYPLLLPAQIMLLLWMTMLSYDNSRGMGYFLVESERVSRRLRWIAGLYAAAMLVRYVIVMSLHPEMRWLHGTIPIAFHWVLAGYIAALTLGMRRNRQR